MAEKKFIAVQDEFQDGLTTEKVEKNKWYKRNNIGIQTKTSDKKDTPEGFWNKCPKCNYITTYEDLKKVNHVCSTCNYHHRLGSHEYFDIIFDKEPEYLFENIRSIDKLQFKDLKLYQDRLNEINESNPELKDSIRVAYGEVHNKKLVVACMDFSFIGGSLGSVMGEKISRSVDFCLEKKAPLLVISKSGGARMMEGAFSLMQLAKTSGKLHYLSEAKIPYISLLTDPSFGGITASFGMLGDLNIAEPGALIGFAGPRVIKETIKRDLPEGFQRSEFLLEHGFIDFIVHRKDLKNTLAQLIRLLEN